MLDNPPPLPPPATVQLSPPGLAPQLELIPASDGGTQHQLQQARPDAQPQSRLEVRPWHLASAIAAYDVAGDWTGAQELWDQALRRGVSPRSPGYDAMVAAAVRAGGGAAARKLVDEARGLRLELAWREEDVV